MRNWLVVTEQPATTRRKIDVAVRSGSGPDSLQKSLAERSSQGYRTALAWKEGNDVVVMMTREASASSGSVSYAVDAMPSAAMRSVSRPYIFDAPYLSDQRLVITEKSGLASNEAVEELLPPIGPLGCRARSAGYAERSPIATSRLLRRLSHRPSRLSQRTRPQNGHDAAVGTRQPAKLQWVTWASSAAALRRRRCPWSR
jgi:hypothetical protein